MKKHTVSALSQISVCTSGISSAMRIFDCLVSQDYPPTYPKLSSFTIDSFLAPFTLGVDGLMPARALFCPVPRVAGIFRCIR